MVKVSNKNNRKLSITISCFAIIISLILYLILIRPQQQYYYSHHVDIKGIYLLKPLEIQDFDLIDNHNKPFTKNNLKGHWTMLFFGFTHCGMVCPTTMDALNKMYTILQKNLRNNDMPQVVFISVDPDRDTIKALNTYVTAFNPHFIGTKTTIKSTIWLEKQFHVISTKTQTKDEGNGNYTIDHSAEILLVNPDAKIQAYFSYPHQPEQLAKDYYSILAKITK